MPHMKVRRRDDHTLGRFLRRTVSAQIHAIGCVLWIFGAMTLIPLASARGTHDLIACLSFLATGFLVFFVSTTYHFVGDGYEASEKLHLFMENLDHFSIYLFIAGTYTPFLLNSVEQPWRNILVVAIWVIAALGIVYTWVKPRLPQFLQRRFVYTGIFVIMGWTLVVRVGEIFHHLNNTQIFYLVAGGLSYSLGAVVYSTKRPKLIPGFFGFHELWHLAVLTGACLHYALILSFYAA